MIKIGGYSPFHTGGRFSANATAPSMASAEKNTGPAILDCRSNASASDQPTAHLGQAEDGLLAGHDEVAGQDDLEPAGQGVPLHRGDDRLGRRALRDAAEPAAACRRVLPGREPLEIHARAEGTARAGDDQRGDVAARVEVVEDRGDA